jgi:periplasmic divalent cation tolerance protein
VKNRRAAGPKSVPSPRKFIQVLTTTDDRKIARLIADRLIAERRAACVQVIGPITSTYRWQGRIAQNREWLCLVKTRRRCYSEVEAIIRALHNYELPEILALPVLAGDSDYLRWLNEETQEGQ